MLLHPNPLLKSRRLPLPLLPLLHRNLRRLPSPSLLGVAILTRRRPRLARVLVSDMIAYNPDRHQQALDGDTLKEDFEEEIVKSMAEYVEQVGKELAESTDYFQKALNEVLARGEQVF